MSIQIYNKYKILINPDSKKTQGLKVGDVVRRQYFDHPNLIYSLMIVLETGSEIVAGKGSHYFIGALIEGDEPKNGELLDFVRVTSLFDTNRSGALYLTASDSDAPYMDVIDGLAFENSLCYPYMGGGEADIPDADKYAVTGKQYLSCTYNHAEQDASRVFRIIRATETASKEIIGLKQSIAKKLQNPQAVIISYKIRASKAIKNVPVKFGYTNGDKYDGTDKINIDTVWSYKLHLISIDYPANYQRSFFIDLSSLLASAGQWCEIADLNIVLLSDISTFARATKARIGKIRGITDPVFGVLDGYGAYFQNLYATKNVNIAGTLTAGDENGFSSTFYVGKIHKNVIRNSIDCFLGDPSVIEIPDEIAPVGVGKVWQMGTSVKYNVQSAEWRKEHIGRQYVFSFWMKVKEGEIISLLFYQDEYFLSEMEITGTGNWERHFFAFIVQDSVNTEFNLRLECSHASKLITAPQLESGTTPSQYQPTDGTLSYIEDYGAWFSKGGIGGTIQNPLLRLNDDGSICSRDGSFVINPDGTGHFASGRFTWSKDTITLKDVTIRWEDFDDEAKEQMYPILLEIQSKSGLVIKNESNDIDAKALLYRNGKEIDTDGSLYIYNWTLWNEAGTDIVKTFTSKAIVVDKSNVQIRAVLSCEVREKS